MTTNQLLLEILEQPQALRRVHQEYISQDHPAFQQAVAILQRSSPVFMTGMATSEYACYPASSRLNLGGRLSFVYDTSELLYYHLPSIQPGSCLVLVSQSGNSAEIVHILKELNGRVPVIGVYNDETSYLARHCAVGLPIYAGPQMACGSKTNLSSVAVLLLLAEAVLGGELERAGWNLARAAESVEDLYANWEALLAPAADFLQDAPYTVFLGRGPGRATAMFSSCLFREVPKVVSEGMGAAMFRHGLREMILPEHRLVIFAPAGGSHGLLVKLAKDMLETGASLLVVSNREVDLPAGPRCYLVRTASQDEFWAPLVDMVPLQLVGYMLARRKGLEPGELLVCNYVTTVE